ncbi:hypothetical protein MRX96_027788 [Rhipicephalus microplus]
MCEADGITNAALRTLLFPAYTTRRREGKRRRQLSALATLGCRPPTPPLHINDEKAESHFGYAYQTTVANGVREAGSAR